MTYKIFRLVGKDRLIPDGYYTKTMTSYKLEEVSLTWTDDYPTYEAAMEAIKDNSVKLQGVGQLTILPVIQLDYNGNVA